MSSTHSGRATEVKAIALRTINPQDCHTFIVQLTDYATDCDRLSDDEWIAEIAALRMSHDALEWYTDQDVETQESWKKLRRALLKEAKLRAGGSSLGASLAAAPPPALVPTPAAVPECTSSTDLATTRVARIRVEAADPPYSGYLSKVLDFNGSIEVTTEASCALTVKYNPINDFPILSITNPSRENTALGFHWAVDPKQGDEYTFAGQLVIVYLTLPTTSSWGTGKGPCDAAAFLILPNSSLLIFSGTSSDRHLLDTYKLRHQNDLYFSVAYNEQMQTGSLTDVLQKAKLKIEPL